ncbi:hypothetical protein AALC25_16245 [Lachnospiraceae bacterium 29-84]
MRKITCICLLAIVCIFLTSCGRNIVGQEKQSAAKQEQQVTEVGDLEKDKKERKEETVEIRGSEAAAEVMEVSKVENIQPNDEGGPYQAEFLGMDTSQVQSCTVYHGEDEEAVDLTMASGKYLLGMMSKYFEDPKYELGLTAGLLLFDDFEETVSKNKDNYYILLQFNQSSPVVLEQVLGRCQRETVTLEGYDRMIVEVDMSGGWLSLYWNGIGDDMDCFYQIASCTPGITEEFQREYEAWQKVEDWQGAFVRLEKETEERKAHGYLAVQDRRSNRTDGFLGVDAQTIQACRIYHGETQEEVDLAEEKGKELLQIMSTFFAEPQYPYEVDPIPEVEGYKEEDLAGIAQAHKDNYYILLSFTQPTDIFLYHEQLQSSITIHSYDSIVLQVDQEEKMVSLDCRQIGDENKAFWGAVGFTKKRAPKDFVQAYEAWKGIE